MVLFMLPAACESASLLVLSFANGKDVKSISQPVDQ